MTDNIYNELRLIRSRVESLEKGQEVLIRAERDAILADVLPAFERDQVLARVFLLVDGASGQRQIASTLRDLGIRGASEATVSRKLEILRDLDLVELVDRTGSGNIYAKSSVDRILRLSRRVQQLLAGTGTTDRS